MTRAVWAIASNTFREAVRNKILYILLLVAVAMIASSILLGKLSLDQHVRVVKDVGLASISIFGVVIAVFIGVNLLYQEIERKTLYTVLTKPISRWQFVLGKYLGMLFTLAISTAGMALVLLGLLATLDVPPDQPLVAAILLSFLELTVVVAVAVFFSAFTTPFLSGAFTLGVFVVGRLTEQLYHALPQLELGPFEDVLVGATWLLPNLYRFNVVERAIYGTPVPWAGVGYVALYGVLYVTCVLAVACLLFSRRDIL